MGGRTARGALDLQDHGPKVDRRLPFRTHLRMEAIIPTEIGLPTIRTATPESENEGSMIRELDTSDELREAAAIQVASYQRRLANFYNKRGKASGVPAGRSSLAKSF